MQSLDCVLNQLASTRRWCYRPGGVQAAEPAAVTALALLSHGRLSAARPALDFLRSIQHPAGEVPVCEGVRTPVWTTAWAVLSWRLASVLLSESSLDYQRAADRAVAALLRHRGVPAHASHFLKHDTTLVGWPWVVQTHSWVEPTALAILALSVGGNSTHARVREGLALLTDRQLPCGGWNYGNTVVLGNMLRPHLQPTGMAVVALAASAEIKDRFRTQIVKACRFIRQALDEARSPSSLAWCWLALAAHGESDDEEFADRWQRLCQRPPATPWGTYQWAVLAWAATGQRNPVWNRARASLKLPVATASSPADMFLHPQPLPADAPVSPPTYGR